MLWPTELKRRSSLPSQATLSSLKRCKVKHNFYNTKEIATFFPDFSSKKSFFPEKSPPPHYYIAKPPLQHPIVHPIFPSTSMPMLTAAPATLHKGKRLATHNAPPPGAVMMHSLMPKRDCAHGVRAQPHNSFQCAVALFLLARLVELARKRIEAQIHCLLKGVGYLRGK